METSLIIRALSSSLNIDEELAEELSNISKIGVLKKNTIIFEQGQICKSMYFVLQGAIRAYTRNCREREYTRSIAIENNSICNVSSFRNTTSSHESFETLEETRFLCIDRDKLVVLQSQNILIKDIYLRILEDFTILDGEKINNILTLNDHERLLYHFRNNIFFVRRFPDRINASFLNMTREIYNRHKKQLSTK